MRKGKIYRCGYCGDVTDILGRPLDGMIREDVINLIESEKNIEVEKVHGDCCAYEREERREWVQVTRDMAIDAGDRNLEGEWVKW